MNVKVGQGSLRAVEARTEKHPGYKGSITIDGKKFWLSGWKKKGDDGKLWLSLTVERDEAAATERKPAMAAGEQRTYAQRRDDVGF
jgi:hypothetical protein